MTSLSDKDRDLLADADFIVVEPHADDAFLSLGQHIAEWQKAGDHVLILTVFSGTRKRAADAAAYAKALKVGWVGLGYVEGSPLPVRLPALPPQARVLLPLAVTHPEHVAVRDRYETMDCWYYLDQPYAITQRNGPRVTKLLEDMTVVSYRHPGVRKYRHIPLFKDQAKFYHYNPAEKLVQTCELIVRDPQGKTVWDS